ncbi:PilN domain-containing protein [Pseudomonas sp. NFXW11]|uniref:PilN domain-containing protein n=1 Tax=Pseudomonas sp. NFXW11 TaxID=2819531 RepID=UPI003CE9296E
MPRINLLPWREAARMQRGRRFLQVLAGMLVLGLALVYLADACIARVLERQQLRSQHLLQATARLDVQIRTVDELKTQRQQLLERMAVIEDLQARRGASVQLFEQLARSLPEGLYFNALDRQGDNLEISGAAESHGRISALMRNLHAAKGFAAPGLAQVKRAEGPGQGRGNLFRLSVGLVPWSPGEPLP